MTALSPAWALAAQALDVRGDQSYLRTGLHLRVMTSPDLGLPVTPLRVLHREIDPATLRTDIVWTTTDVNPRVLNPPFAVTADQPAIGWLPPTIDATCCWIDVDVDVDDHVQVSAMLPTGRGPRPVATRSARPYQVWASAIQQVLVTGNGTVHGARWLPADVDSDQLIKLTALPVARPHPRYAALDNGVLVAAARVARGAPIRRALVRRRRHAPPVPSGSADRRRRGRARRRAVGRPA